jgi:acetoin utilization protein AcuC
MPVGFVYTDDFRSYNFGEGHPLTPLRIDLSFSLMKAYHLLENPNIHLITPRVATEKEVLRIHSEQYLNKLKDLNDIAEPSYQVFSEFGLGPGDNPIFPKMYDAAMAVCGASLSAADYLLNDEINRSFNILGGLHHAMPDMASGFCLLNDAAVAIQYLLDNNPGSKVMYLDIDCHHGDGVQWIFYDRKDVLTLSFHQTGKTLFPGTGFMKENGKNEGKGYSLNVPLLPRTNDEIYYETFTKILPMVMEAYQPDFLVCQLGVDTHFTDPLTEMGLSTTMHEKVFKIINANAKKYANDKFLALGGGGYNINVVARSWSLMLAELLETKIEDTLPQVWLDDLNAKWTDQPAPDTLRDKNYYMETLMMKDPYYFDDLEMHSNKIIEKFEKEFVPAIKK